MIAAVALALAASGPAPGREPAKDEIVETESRADLDGDGVMDRAYVIARAEDRRELRVVTSAGGSKGSDRVITQVLPLDPYPLAPARLTMKGGVLLLEDLGGGTTAIASTHRFRWDAKLGAMRLIGLDAALYSRTFAHDGREVSWNLLTGDRTSRTLKLRTDGDARAYDYVDAARTKRRSPPLRLEVSPDGATLLGWPGGKEENDRP